MNNEHNSTLASSREIIRMSAKILECQISKWKVELDNMRKSEKPSPHYDIVLTKQINETKNAIRYLHEIWHTISHMDKVLVLNA